MIHRAILGSFERMVAILLEHYGGKWPLWLSPRQAIVCPTAPKPESGYNKEAILEYAKEVRGKMHKAGFYVDVDMTDETFNKKVALAQAAQYNYILAVGPTEVNSGEVTIRVRDKKDQALSTVSVDDAIRRFREEVAAFQ